MEINDPTECDCGRPKFGGAECCSRCAFLDGAGVPEAQVIDALRLHGWLTAREIGNVISRHPETVNRIALELHASGRLCRQWREGDGGEYIGRNRYGGTQRMKGGAGAWEYSLAMKRAA